LILSEQIHDAVAQFNLINTFGALIAWFRELQSLDLSNIYTERKFEVGIVEIIYLDYNSWKNGVVKV